MGFEYIGILSVLILSFALGIILFSLSIFISVNFLHINERYFEKLSAYECGFNPFSDARQKFDVRFYLVGLLFLIFDLEVVFLFPWAVCLNKIGFLGFWLMMLFLIILTIGFFYEWSQGAIDWE